MLAVMPVKSGLRSYGGLRYISKYELPNRMRSISISLFIILLCSILTFAEYYNTGKILLCRDNSLIIILQSVVLFNLFVKIKLKSRLINELSRAVFMVYLINFFVRDIINEYCFAIYSADFPVPFLIVFVITIFTFIFGYLLELIHTRLVNFIKKRNGSNRLCKENINSNACL